MLNASRARNVFESTYQGLPKRLNEFSYPSNSYLRVTIEVVEKEHENTNPGYDTLYQFLNDDIWIDELATLLARRSNYQFSGTKHQEIYQSKYPIIVRPGYED